MKKIISSIITYALYPVYLLTVIALTVAAIHHHWDYKLTYALITVGMIVTFIAVESIFPLGIQWKMSGKNFLRDLKYIAVDAPVIGITKFAFGYFAIYYSESHQGVFTRVPIVVSVIGFLLVFEFFQYWYHRISHSGRGRFGRFLWNVHLAHHLPDKVYVVMHAVFNPINAFITTIIIQTPLILLGISPEAALAATLLIDLQSLISHFNVKIRAGFLNYIFIGTETHRYHHSTNMDEAKNYGNTLAIWDIIFGTFYYKPGAVPKQLGIEDQEKLPSSNNLWRVVTLPFKKTKTIMVMIVVAASSFSEPLKGQSIQEGNIKGNVIDKATKQPIPGVNVLMSGSPAGATTDTAGFFILKKIEPGNYTLTITFVGYQEKAINDVHCMRDKTTFIEVELEESRQNLDEVSVTAYKYENNPLTPVSMYSFSREEISRNPGAQGDIFRAIGMLPGVTSSGGAFSAIAVRGQGTRDNVYIVDDIPVFSLAHLDSSPSGFDDPNGGRFSIFAPRVIDNAQFQGGGFAAQYGRRSASYLGLGIKEGNKENPVVDGQLDLLGATVNYDGPSYALKNTSLFISARYQDFTKLVQLVNLKDLGIPKYQDFIFKSTTQLGAKNKLSLIALYSPETFVRDASNVREDRNLNSLFILNRRSSQGIFGLNLRTITGERSYWKNVVFYDVSDCRNDYGKAFPKTDTTGVLLETSTISSESGIRKITYTESRLGLRSIYTANFKNNATLTAGIEFDRSTIVNNRKLSRADTLFVYGPNDFRPSPTTFYSLLTPALFNADYSGYGYNGAAYLDYSFVLLRHLTMNAGLRYDYTGFSDQSTMSPRVSGSWQLNETSSLNFASGIYYQDPAYSSVADQPKDKRLRNQQVIQYIIGYRKYFTPDFKLTLEGWYKNLDNLLVRPVSGSSEQTNSGTGWAEGIDINLVKRLSKNYHGQIGYSYMISKRDDHDGLGEYDFTFSQPHQFTMLLSYKTGKHWILSGKFRYSTGKPTYNYSIHANVFNDPNTLRSSQEIITGQKRLPDFVSLDIRVNYRFEVDRLALTAFVDIVNILNRPNAYQQSFNALTGKTFYEGIAIFPTFGLKFEF